MTTPSKSAKTKWTPMQDALLVDAAHSLDFHWILVAERVKCKDLNECKKRLVKDSADPQVRLVLLIGRFQELKAMGKGDPFPKSAEKLKRNLSVETLADDQGLAHCSKISRKPALPSPVLVPNPPQSTLSKSHAPSTGSPLRNLLRIPDSNLKNAKDGKVRSSPLKLHLGSKTRISPTQTIRSLQKHSPRRPKKTSPPKLSPLKKKISPRGSLLSPSARKAIYSSPQKVKQLLAQKGFRSSCSPSKLTRLVSPSKLHKLLSPQKLGRLRSPPAASSKFQKMVSHLADGSPLKMKLFTPRTGEPALAVRTLTRNCQTHSLPKPQQTYPGLHLPKRYSESSPVLSSSHFSFENFERLSGKTGQGASKSLPPSSMDGPSPRKLAMYASFPRAQDAAPHETAPNGVQIKKEEFDMSDFFNLDPSTHLVPTAIDSLPSEPDFFSSTQEAEGNAYGEPRSHTDGFLDSFLSPPPLPDGGLWDDLFNSTVDGSGQSTLDVFGDIQSAPATMESIAAKEGANLDVPFATLGSFLFEPAFAADDAVAEKVIPSTARVADCCVGAEVDDLFKETAKDSGFSTVLANTNLPATVQNKASEINWLVQGASGFSLEQISMLRSQIGQTFQLCIQALALDTELNGKQEDNFWQDQLYGVQTIGSRSVFDIAGLEEGPSVSSMLSGVPDRQFVADFNSKLEKKKRDSSLALPKNLVALIGKFEGLFSPHLIPTLQPTKRSLKSYFTSHEDALLFQGIVRFGAIDTASIQSHCLPGRTCTQIYNRIKNVAKRNEGPSLIKEFCLLPFKPMNYVEKFILKQDFKNAAPIVFPHIPGPLVEVAWKELYQIKEVAIPYSESSASRPPTLKSLTRAKQKLKSRVPKYTLAPRQTTVPKLAPAPQQAHRRALLNLTSEADPHFAPAPTPSAPRHPRNETLQLSDLQSAGDTEPLVHLDLENETNSLDGLLLESRGPLAKPLQEVHGSQTTGISVSSPGPTGISDRLVRGVGRGSMRKKRTRIDKDIIDHPASLKKVRSDCANGSTDSEENCRY
ncbi:hypothetical protein HDU91_002719 [Kappamyces sp. JEL0680]|nr:hypothetical protein HDU91_002719 [Kappamyces sp. JEL0680]